MSEFLLPQEEYQRSISPIQDWIHQTSIYASKMLGLDLETCKEHLKHKLKTKELTFNDPIVTHYLRPNLEDRELTKSNLTHYLYDTLKKDEILVPTFTTYVNPSVRRSNIVGYVDNGVMLRSKHKKLSQKYEAEGNELLYVYHGQFQDNAKRKNNAVSGGFVAEGSVIQNKSAHSTLTSTTRTLSSISNMSNERLVEGNRHYYTPKVTLYNCISIVAECDKELIEEAIYAYGLKYPGVEDTLNCIHRSSDLYWKDREASREIREFIEKLEGFERAAIVYTGDLYHVRVLNESFMRTFIEDFASIENDTPVPDVINFLYKYDESIVNYAHQCRISMLRGKGKDYSKLTQREQYILANTCISITNAIQKYRIFLRAFFLTKNSPCTTATVPHMVRRCVVLSDTDSTMFSVDNWVEWYFKKLEFSDRGFAIAGAIMFMATSCMAHIIAQFSANMGVERSKLFKLAMKPEFVFPVFGQTSVAKHYYTAMLVKEGNVYPDIKMEIKGVHLKDSTMPQDIIDQAATCMEDIIRTVMREEKISLRSKIEETVKIEKTIETSILNGSTEYLKRFKVKEASAYKDSSDISPYRFYTLWNYFFSEKYGEAPQPPYDAVIIPLRMPNKTAIKEWIDGIEDPSIQLKVASFFKSHPTTRITAFPIAMDIIYTKGIPREFMPILDIKRSILTLTKSYRNILNSLGYFPKHHMLVSEIQEV